MVYVLFAIVGAIFTALTTIFAKIGIKDVKSNFATAYRTLIVILCAVIMCLITGDIKEFFSLDYKNWIFLILSGIATGSSWLCYYKALKLGDVNSVAAIDKSSFILTSILFLIFFFNDVTKNGDTLTIIMLAISILLIGVGVILMATKNGKINSGNRLMLLFAFLSAIFASFVSLFVKIGLNGIPSDLGTLIRTIIVFIFASSIAFTKKEHKDISYINAKSWVFLTLSGIATGGAWLSEYYALNMINANPIAVNSISKFSIVITMGFSYFVLKEKFTKRSLLGLALLIIGIILIVIFSL